MLLDHPCISSLQIFPPTEKIENINDQYWTLRAEEASHDSLSHAFYSAGSVYSIQFYIALSTVLFDISNQFIFLFFSFSLT